MYHGLGRSSEYGHNNVSFRHSGYIYRCCVSSVITGTTIRSKRGVAEYRRQ